MSISLVYAFSASVILLTASMQLFLPVTVKHKPVYIFLLLIIALLILLLRVNEVPVFYYLRGYVGDLSITSSLFFAASIIQSGWGKTIYLPVEKKYLGFLVILGGLFLYPLALGSGQFDPYTLGFQPQLLLSVLFFTGFYFWYRQCYFLVFILSSAGLCFALGLLESNNLWDYLLDPVLMLVFLTLGLFSVLKAGIKRVWK